MNKRYILLILGAVMIASIALGFLYLQSPLSKPITPSSFNRSFIHKDSIQIKAEADIQVNSFYIAGVTNRHIYLGNSTAPFHVLKMSHSLNEQEHVDIKVHLDSIKNFLAFELKIDSPYFYLLHGMEPIIMRGRIGKWEAYRLFSESDYYFNEGIPVGAKSFLVKSYHPVTQSFELAKKTEGYFGWNEKLLEKTLDGLFDVDGKMYFDKGRNLFVYTYFYRNSIIVSDSNLANHRILHTIDTFSVPYLKITKVNNGTESMPAEPPFRINDISGFSNGILILKSRLLAKNQDRNTFLKASTFDVYDVVNGKYLKSFQIPDYEGSSLRSIQLVGNKIFMVYGESIVVYEILDKSFKRID